MAPYTFKRIADPVHGTIGLSEWETAILNTDVFRRLRNIRQLGLAYYVYPGADYSRLSHSLGACHVTGRILDALEQAGFPIQPRERQLYRMAALLHDVGHYPFSHAMEDAISGCFSERLLKTKGEPEVPASGDGAADLPAWLKHEHVGEEILKRDGELRDLLGKADIAPDEVYSIFNRRRPPRFSNLVSSDLDADRTDYLLRTARHTGLPYGSVDLDYLLSQMRIDADQRVCITSKALRTADHFLLCRYFDYQQVSYHKTVAGLELVLKDVLAELLRSGTLTVDGSAASVLRAIDTGEWCNFDDVEAFSAIRNLARESSDAVVRQKASAIVERNPPKLVDEFEFVGSPKQQTEYDLRRKLCKSKKSDWAKRFGIEPALWYVWSNNTTLTKIGPSVPLSVVEQDPQKDRDRIEQSIRVLDPGETRSRPIVEHERSLMSILASSSLYSVRVYALLPSTKSRLRESIAAQIRADMESP